MNYSTCILWVEFEAELMRSFDDCEVHLRKDKKDHLIIIKLCVYRGKEMYFSYGHINSYDLENNTTNKNRLQALQNEIIETMETKVRNGKPDGLNYLSDPRIDAALRTPQYEIKTPIWETP